jgi:hypothetical protein
MVNDVPLWATALISIGFGTIASAFITTFANGRMKVREHYYEMARHKLDIISQSLPFYFQSATYYKELSDL